MSARARVDRVRFAQGHRLLAADLSASTGEAERLLELHVVAAHGTWGIALGLEVAGGISGLTVAPGVAYDALGRALALVRETPLRLPERLAGAQSVDAVVRKGSCGSEVVLIGRGEVRSGLDVLLARLPVAGGSLGPPDAGVRRRVRTTAQPRLGTGRVELVVDSETAGLGYAVDTTAAGFTSTPVYVITPVLDRQGLGDIAASGATVPLVSLAKPTATGFDVEVRLAGDPGGPLAFPLAIEWLGVEPPPSCPAPTAKDPIEVP